MPSPLPAPRYEAVSSHRRVDGHRETRTPGNIRKEVWDALYRGDLHKTNFVACVLAAQGKPRLLTFSLDAEGQAAFCRHLRPEDEIAVEVGQNAYCCYEQVCVRVKRIVLVNTHRFALISRLKKKTDRQDAILLARFLKRGWLPTVSVPDTRIRQLRQCSRPVMGGGAEGRRNLVLGMNQDLS
jgi:transposase